MIRTPENEQARGQASLVGKSRSIQQSGFCYPAAPSVKARVLADLLTGAKLSHADVWHRHGSSRAAHHIMMLRRAGFPIVTVEIEVPTSDGRVARIAEYHLPPEAIAEAGDRGQEFAAECARINSARRAE